MKKIKSKWDLYMLLDYQRKTAIIVFILQWILYLKGNNSIFRSFSVYLVSMLVGIIIFKRAMFKEIRKTENFSKNIFSGVLMLIIASLLSGIIGKVLNVQPANDLLLKGAPLYYLLIVGCFIGPISEEIFFRFFLFRYIREKSALAAHLIVAILFALWHTGYFVIRGDVMQLITTLTYLPLSFLFSLVYEKTKNITFPIVLHIINNSIMAILLIIIQIPIHH